MENIEFGKRLENLMIKRNISNSQITDLAQISKNNIGNYKKGQIPNAMILHRLSQILGTSMEYLLIGKEPEALTPEEQQLIDAFRAADQRGKRRILQAAETELQEVKSSILPIGSTGTDK